MGDKIPELSEGLPTCPKCGGGPILVRMVFRERSAEKYMTAAGNMVYSYHYIPKAYLHCPCDHCVTDWCKGVRQRNGYVFGSEVRAAEKAWCNSQWVSIEENESEKED